MIRSLLLLTLFFPLLSIAQSDFRKGYIVDNKSDTTFGLIDYRGDLMMSSICRFKTNQSAEIQEFYPHSLHSFQFIDGKYYISRKFEDRQLFLEYLINGELNIYYYRDDRGDHYLADKTDGRIVELPYKEGITYRNGRDYDYKSTRHRGVLTYLTKEVPELQSRTMSFGKPKHENLIKLAKDYHEVICPDHDCTIYEKKLPAFSAIIEIPFAFIKFDNDPFDTDFNLKTDEQFLSTGLLINALLSRVNEKVRLRTGVLFPVGDHGEKDVFRYKIPIQFEYIYPKGGFRPKFAYGINLYNPFYQSVSLMGGFNINASQNSGFFFAYDIDFNPNENVPLIPRNIFSKSFSFGINIGINN